MPAALYDFGNPHYSSRVAVQTLTGATDATDWVGLSGAVCVQITGSASSVTAVVERASLDPTNPNTAGIAPVAPADTTGITGNPSTGISPVSYIEPATGWWRVRLTALAGGSAVVSISGGKA